MSTHVKKITPCIRCTPKTTLVLGCSGTIETMKTRIHVQDALSLLTLNFCGKKVRLTGGMITFSW